MTQRGNANTRSTLLPHVLVVVPAAREAVCKNKKRLSFFLGIGILLFFLAGCVATKSNVQELGRIKSLAKSKGQSRAPVSMVEYITDLEFIPSKNGNIVKEKETKWLLVNSRDNPSIQAITVYQQKTFEKKIKIQAQAYYPDGSTWSLTEDDLAVDDEPLESNIRYSFRLPGYQRGLLVQLTVEREYIQPEFFGCYHLRARLPVHKRIIRLTYPDSAGLIYGVENGEKADVEESFIVESGRRIVTVTASSLTNYRERGRTNAPGSYYAAFHVSFPPKGNRSYTWQELGDHYLKLSAAAFDISPEIRQLAKKVSSDSTDATIRAIFDKVVSTIRYHGDWGERYSFFPRKASVVKENGYGDCKEISTIMKSLLNAVGIEAYPVLLATRRHFQPVAAYQLLRNFNHMILAVRKDNGELLFLDGTHSEASTKSSYYESIGRTAYVLERGNSRLIDIEPGKDYENKVVTDSIVEYNKDEKAWLLKGRITMFGHPALFFRERLAWELPPKRNANTRTFLEKYFHIPVISAELKLNEADKVIIDYVADFDENYLEPGDGGLRLNTPHLFTGAVQSELLDQLGNVYFQRYNQEDNWEVPFAPQAKALPQYSTALAKYNWNTAGRKITRTYSQQATIKKQVDDTMQNWHSKILSLNNGVIWR